MENKGDMETYAEYLTEEELSKQTKEIYLREAERLERFLDHGAITKKRMIAYKEYLSSVGYAVTTLNLHIVAVNRYLRFLGYQDCALRTNRIQGGQSLEDTITLEEYRRLLEYARESGREKYYAILKTLAMTGIRIGELEYFTVEALDRKYIRVTNKKKTREICLPDHLIAELGAYCEAAGIGDGVIFRGRGGRPISRVAVYQMLTRMADALGIAKGKVHPHSFRHLFALTYMQNYANIFELADLLGHSNLETTRIYARSTRNEKRKRINDMGL